MKNATKVTVNVLLAFLSFITFASGTSEFNKATDGIEVFKGVFLMIVGSIAVWSSIKNAMRKELPWE